MTTLAPNMPVTWQSGPAKYPITLTGHVVSVKGTMAHVRCNGEVYTVDAAKLRPARAPIMRPTCNRHGCDKAIGYPGSAYCSRICFAKAREDESDNAVFAMLVRYKAAHDGVSPSTQEIADETGIFRSSVTRSLARLANAGRIVYSKTGKQRAIRVVGGRWVYEEAI